MSHDPSPLAEPKGAPRSRLQVLDTAARLFEEMLEVGLSHLSTTTCRRLSTLAVSANGVQLPRLSLLLRRVADSARQLVERSASGDERRLLGLLAQTYGLIRALRRRLSAERPPASDELPLEELVGRHRSRYREIDPVLLTGLGAQRWQTQSGYWGLTLYLLEESTGHWYTWSDSRPLAGDPAFDPRRRYLEASPWSGAGSPLETSRSRLRLVGARANDRRRLSSTRRCVAERLGPTRPREVDFGPRRFERWEELRRLAATEVAVGLELAPPDQPVLVHPTAWLEPRFDEVEQRLVVELVDRDGATVAAELPHGPLHGGAILHLQRLASMQDRVWALLAQVTTAEEGIRLRPITAILEPAAKEEETFLHLTLDLVPDRPGRSVPPEPARSGQPEGGDRPPRPAWGGSVEQRVSQLETILARIAEAGTGAAAREEELRRLAGELDEHSLPQLGDAARQLLAARTPQHRGASLLRARFLCDLHRGLAVREGLRRGNLS